MTKFEEKLRSPSKLLILAVTDGPVPSQASRSTRFAVERLKNTERAAALLYEASERKMCTNQSKVRCFC